MKKKPGEIAPSSERRKSTPIAKHLRHNPEWKSATPDAREAFRVKMRGHQYESVCTRKAWDFFYSGYHAGLAGQVRVQSITQAVEARNANLPVIPDGQP